MPSARVRTGYLILLLSEGEMRDFKGAALMIDILPEAKGLPGNRGYDADRFRAAFAARGIIACIPPKAIARIRFRLNQ